jgi:hypothetical protein
MPASRAFALMAATKKSPTNASKPFLQETSSHRRWLLLDAALHTSDLGDEYRSAPEWVQRMGATMPPLMAEYASKQSKNRREKIAHDTKSRGRPQLNS